MMGMWDRSTGTLKLPKLGRDLRHMQSMSAGCRGAAMGCNGLFGAALSLHAWDAGVNSTLSMRPDTLVWCLPPGLDLSVSSPAHHMVCILYAHPIMCICFYTAFVQHAPSSKRNTHMHSSAYLELPTKAFSVCRSLLIP